jgi:hypothetical protein
MASILRFDNWQNSDGTSIATTDASGNISFAGAGAGKILQVVNDYRSGLSTTSTSLVATNASLTITPSAATSKVLVIASVYQVRNNTANADVYFAIDRDGTTIGGGDQTRFTSAVSNARTSVTFYNLDSPASTSALTYTLQWRVSTGTGTIENAHSIMAIEVGA